VLQAKDGRGTDVSVSISPVRNSDHELVGTSSIVRDITQRKRAEEALHESEARFRIMADSCPTVMWVTDACGETRFVNRTYREFFGIPFVEGSKWKPLFHPDDYAQYVASFYQALALQGALHRRSAGPPRRRRMAVGRLLCQPTLLAAR
jgi:PAS domain-containing protein